MAQTIQILLFGDQTFDFAPTLKNLLVQKDNPMLTSFLEQSHYVLRALMAQHLGQAEHKRGRSSSLSQMVTKYLHGDYNPAFQTALACVSQLGTFIEQYSQPNRQYPGPEDTYVLGLCTGSLAAAAVGSCRSISELLPAAVQTVQVAWRLGLCATRMRDRIELPDAGLSDEWSLVFLDMTPAEAKSKIGEFCTYMSLPVARQPWITATASSSTTISGPPSTLQLLLTHPAFSGCRMRRIPIKVPSHTAHLFTQSDISDILNTTLARDWSGYIPRLPVISGFDGKLAWSGSLRTLLERALCDCLLEPLCWDEVEKAVPILLQSRGMDTIRILPVGSNAARTLSNSLHNIAEVVIGFDIPDESVPQHRSGTNKSKLAIVGMSGRFPEAQDTSAFWDLLYKGLDVCKQVPAERWNVETHVDPSGKAHNKGACPWGCWLDFAAEFDAKFFSISPKEAEQMDPAQRMALMSTWEAIERGGIVADTTPSTQRNRIGVFHGVTSNDWMETNTAQNIETYFITGGNRGFIPGRINFCFEFSGPSFTNDTACSSSLAAIHLACNSLWRGDCDTAVAGGTNMIFTPDGHAGLDKGFFLSRTGNCKAFDDAADGYCRAEGVGTVLVKRLEDAIADKDPILAVILDTKTNHSAMSESMTRPHVGAQVDNMRAILDSNCIDPNSLSYIEMHGTGTQVGDAVEMESVLSIFAPTESARPKDRPLHVGSAKANIGHGEGVSGVTSLIKCLLMMKHDTIPPHCGIKPGSKINHNYPDLTARNVHIAMEPKPWPRGSYPRRVLINNFSAAGGNTALLLEDAPNQDLLPVIDPRKTLMVCTSAVVGKSLKANLQALVKYIAENQDSSLTLSRLSWTTTARRWHHIHRVCVTGTSLMEISSKIQLAIDAGDGMTRAKVRPNILMAFTGQGSQYLGMGAQLYESNPTFRHNVDAFDRLSQQLGFPTILPIIMESSGDIESYTPVEVQLAITILQLALVEYLQTIGIVADAVVGHSLGEYAALYAAGCLSAVDTIFLVGKRADLLQSYCQRGTHAMLAVRASVPTLAALLKGIAYNIACLNGPEDTVLSGTNKQILEIQNIVSKANIKSTLLKLPFAFHSAQVDAITAPFEALAAHITFKEPRIPLLSPLLGKPITSAVQLDAAYLSQHCRKAVNMTAALESGKTLSILSESTVMVEVGPQPLISGMAKSTFGSHFATLPTLQRGRDTFANMANLVATLYNRGADIDWVAFHEPYEAAHKVIDLPSYAWDLKKFWLPYEGDWCLHRHKIECDCADPTKTQTTGTGPSRALDASQVAHKAAAAAIVFEPTTCVHEVVEETTAALGATLVVHTDCSRIDTNHVVQGHQVNHIALCTPSVYADIALTIGKYTMDKLRSAHQGAQDGIVDVSDLVVEKALIPHGQGPQILRTTLTVSWPPKAAASARSAKVEFSSLKPDGSVDTKHAWCTVRFATRSALQKLQERVPEFHAKVNRLRDGIKTGQFVKYNKTSGYKLMSNVAHFHPDYKLLDNLILDESTLEACSQITFDGIKSEGKFAAHPAAVDAITQVGGFAMNAKDSTDLDKDVYVNHGWESFQVYEPLAKGITYEVYCQMVPDKKGDLVHGDTIVLNKDKVVACFKGLSLRNVPRKALRMVLQQSFDKGARQAGKPVSKNPTYDLSVGPAPSAVKVTTPNVTLAVQPARSTQTPVTVAILPQNGSHNIGQQKSGEAENNRTSATNAAVEAAIAIVADESGLAITDLTDDSSFIEVGIDSLASMAITSRFREELGMDLDSSFSIFTDFPTVKDLRNFLGAGDSSAEAATHVTIKSELSDSDTSHSASSSSSDAGGTPDSDTDVDDMPVSKPRLNDFCKPATSFILQGIPRIASKILFMLPDGGGSASSYLSIPQLAGDIAIVGLNCPYARDPENMTCTWQSMIAAFVAEIRRRQPSGPYHLGGWSSGGAFAYVTAEALVNDGEEVHSLIIVDAPVPQVMEKLPVEFYEHCNSVGLFANQPGGGASASPPPYLIPHFVAVVDVMLDYKVAPLKTSRMPKVGILWAAETVMEEDNAPKMKGMHFMIQKRTDFGPDGWDIVCPGAEFDIVKAHANHFSLMQGANVVLVKDLIDRVMS